MKSTNSILTQIFEPFFLSLDSEYFANISDRITNYSRVFQVKLCGVESDDYAPAMGTSMSTAKCKRPMKKHPQASVHI